MWLKKEEYARLVATDIDYANEKFELKKLIKEAKQAKKDAPRKFTVIKPPAEDQQLSYLNSIAETYQNSYFQWFMQEIRETVLSQVAGNMPGASGLFFLRNNEELAGALKVLGYIQSQMESKKEQYDIIIDSEQRARDEEI